MATLVVLSPETNGHDEMLVNFHRAHHRIEDEVRFIFRGQGLFTYDTEEGDPFTAMVLAGGYVTFPAGMYYLVYPH